MHRLGLFVLCLLPLNMLFAQSFIRTSPISSSTGTNLSVSADDTLPAIHITKWVGETILFMPILKKKQQFGYTDFKGGDGINGRPSYNSTIGKTAIVTAVTPDSIAGEYRVDVKMTDNGVHYRGVTVDGVLSRVCLIRDLEAASKKLKGQTAWLKKDYIYTMNDETEKIERINGVRFRKVKLTDVYASYDDNAPVQLILELENGTKGYLNVNLGNSNILSYMKNTNLLSSYFYRADPKLTYTFKKEAWDAIESREVFKGMTTEEAGLSWGPPDEIINIGEIQKWNFKGGSSLSFKNGKLVEIKQ